MMTPIDARRAEGSHTAPLMPRCANLRDRSRSEEYAHRLTQSQRDSIEAIRRWRGVSELP